MPIESMGFANMGSMIGRQIMGGQNNYELGYGKMAQMLADTSLKQAHGDYYRTKADQERQRSQYQTPEFASKIAASIAGLSEPQAGEMESFTKNGNWGMNPAREDPVQQMTLAPSPKAAPEWATPETIGKYNAGRSAHLVNLGATGNSNADQMVKALAGILGQGRIDSAITDPSKAPIIGQAVAAGEGKPLYHQGANGVMQLFTGQERLNDVGNSAAMENRAQAGNASASAALHRAQIPEVQSRIDLNRSKIGQDQIINNPDGSQTIIRASGKAEKAPTEFQGKSALYGARAKEAHDIMLALEGLTGKDAYNRLAATSFGGNGVMNTLANPVMSESTQKAVQAQRDFINAVLRQESGAAISQPEFENAIKQYFPQPGDKNDVLEQKRRNRETAIMGFQNSAGKAAFDAPPLPSQQSKQSVDRVSAMAEAKAAIAAGAPRAAVIQRLKEMGIKDGAL